VIPTVNIGHLQLIPAQRQNHNLQKGFLVCNSNCAVVGLAVPFAALQSLGPVDQVSIVTMQAISGAGYPGVSSKWEPAVDIVMLTTPRHGYLGQHRAFHPW
jgi:aspartate-semialdehyde dehydrogenase